MHHNIRNIFLTSLSWLILSGCHPGVQENDFRDACWIGAPDPQFSHDSLLFEENPAPLLRKEFLAGDEIKSAILYITAAGYYSAFLNGERIGINQLDPAWTDYSKRIYYTSYDITTEVRKAHVINHQPPGQSIWPLGTAFTILFHYACGDGAT